jgi:hypothetical protein
MSKTTKWDWTNKEHTAFEIIKQIMSHKVLLLSHPDFSKPFETHTNASNHQMGGHFIKVENP